MELTYTRLALTYYRRFCADVLRSGALTALPSPADILWCVWSLAQKREWRLRFRWSYPRDRGSWNNILTVDSGGRYWRAFNWETPLFPWNDVHVGEASTQLADCLPTLLTEAPPEPPDF